MLVRSLLWAPAERKGRAAPLVLNSFLFFPAAQGVSTDDELRDLLRVAGPRPVVVDYGARWCDHCKTMAPTFARLADEVSTSRGCPP